MANLKEAYRNVENALELFRSTQGEQIFHGIDLLDLLRPQLLRFERDRKILSTPLKQRIKQFLLDKFRVIYSLQWTSIKCSTIFIWVREPNHIESTLGIYEILKSNKKYRVIYITNKYSIAKKLRELGAQNMYLGEFALSYGLFLKFSHKENNPIEVLLNKNSPVVKNLYYKALKLFQGNPDNLLVLANDQTLEGRLLVKICKKIGLRTFLIQHGNINTLSPHMKDIISDYFYVYGNRIKEHLDNLGLGTEVIVTGSIKHSRIRKPEIETLRPKFEAAKIFDDYVFVAFSGPGHHTSLDHHQKLVALVKRLQQEIASNIIIKLHPKDNRLHYKIDWNNKIRILTNNDLVKWQLSFSDLIINSRFVVTGSSTAALEALLLNKLPLTVDLNDEYHDVNFISDSLTIHTTSEIKFIQEVKALLNDESILQKLLKQKIDRLGEYFYGLSLKNYSPSEAIVDHMLKVAAK